MADKKELIEAMKVIKDHCKSIALNCKNCKIEVKCKTYFKTSNYLPQEWYTDGGEFND